VLLFRRVKSPDAGPDEHADFVPVGFVQIQAGIDQRLMGGKYAELRKPVRAPCLLRGWKRVRRIKVLHFTGNLRIEGRGVEKGNRPDAALACH
jgi:hypothetical protein